MDIEVKLTSIHVIAAIIAGYISFIISSGIISGVGKNEYVAILIGLIILYITGQVSENILGKEEVGGFKSWFWSGIVPFILIWIVSWAVFMNY